MYKLIDVSGDRKTGPIPVVWGSKNTCPPTCGLYELCYAKMGHSNIHFNNAANGVSFDKVINWVHKIRKHSVWRFGVSGELPGNHVNLDADNIVKLAKANAKKDAIIYTHYPINEHNLSLAKVVKAMNLIINFSCDSIDAVKTVVANKLNAVTYTAWDDQRKSWTQDGIKFVTCPNQTLKSKPQCMDCKLCAKDRDYVIVFRAHGVAKKRIPVVV